MMQVDQQGAIRVLRDQQMEHTGLQVVVDPAKVDGQGVSEFYHSLTGVVHQVAADEESEGSGYLMIQLDMPSFKELQRRRVALQEPGKPLPFTLLNEESRRILVPSGVVSLNKTPTE